MAQYRRDTHKYLSDGNTIFEVVMVADSNGAFYDMNNRLPVTLGSDTITIAGNVNILDIVTVNSSPSNPVHTHITEVGTSGVLNVDYIPISGNVRVTYIPTVNVGNYPVNQNVSLINTANTYIVNTANTKIYHSNGYNITPSAPLPVSIQPAAKPNLFSFNNFGQFSHRGWTMSDNLIPMVLIRAKSGSTKTGNIINYDIGNNNAASSTVGYIWYENVTITGAAYSWVSLNSDMEYAILTDNYGSNTPNGFSGGTARHAGIIIGKNSSAESDIADLDLVSGGITLCLAVQRLDSATKLDLWFAIDVAIS